MTDLAAAFEGELARRYLADFGALMLGDEYDRAAHTDLLCDRLEAVERGDVRRIIVTMPPRCGKSTTVSRLFPAWALGRQPKRSVVIASYASELAEGHSRRARGFLLDHRYPFETRVSTESAAVNRWNTREGGTCIAVGIGGGLTGWGADVAIVDDAFGSRDDADSEAYRERVWRWWTEVLLTRLQPGASVVLMHTRWHEDDLVGRVLNGPGADVWELLSLPALAEENDPLGREEGQALWPEKYDLASLADQREQLGPRSFAALYQQRPASAEGGTFKRGWLEGRYDRPPKGGLHVVTAVDASFGKGVGSDHSAVVTVAADGRFYYVLDCVRGRWEYGERVERIKSAASTWNPGAILVEDAASGTSAIQTLRSSTDLPVIPVKPRGNKLARAESVTGLMEAQKVLFPSQAPAWRDDLIEELAGFPAAKHDDQTDALVYALMRLCERGASGAGVAGSVSYSKNEVITRRGDRATRRDLDYERTLARRKRTRAARLYIGPREADD